ncbi:MAG: LysM peptidoglycan-binding domain-containing protein [Acidimicrobiales bacterium]
MVAIQVLPLEPDPWPEADEGHDEGAEQRERHVERRTVPDRATRFRRRRLGALLVVAAVVAMAFAVVDVIAGGPTDVPRSPAGEAGARGPIVDEVYVVQPGDTLWSIAERVAPRADPRHVVTELRELTGDVALDVGDRVPVGDLRSS